MPKTQNQTRNTRLSPVTIGTNLFLATILLITLLVVVIGVNHTAIYAIGHLWQETFSIFIPSLTLAFAVGVSFLLHPVHSLLALITVFFNTVLLYLTAKAQFLAFVFLIVYVGAIAILFLFVIMLLNVKELMVGTRQNVLGSNRFALVVALPSSFIFMVYVSQVLETFVAMTTEPGVVPLTVDAMLGFVRNEFRDILVFSDALYTTYSYLFVLAGLLLLTAMVGAIVLASSTTEHNNDLLGNDNEPTL